MICSEADNSDSEQVELEGGKTGSAVAAVIRKKQGVSGKHDEFIGNLVIVRDITTEKEKLVWPHRMSN